MRKNQKPSKCKVGGGGGGRAAQQIVFFFAPPPGSEGSSFLTAAFGSGSDKRKMQQIVSEIHAQVESNLARGLAMKHLWSWHDVEEQVDFSQN